ncbi:hypothetical protein ACOMHN_012198 [Nucella lapillus]
MHKTLHNNAVSFLPHTSHSVSGQCPGCTVRQAGQCPARSRYDLWAVQCSLGTDLPAHAMTCVRQEGDCVVM